MCSTFPSSEGARKSASNEQNVRAYYMLNRRIGDLLFHSEKSSQICFFQSFGQKTCETWTLQRNTQFYCVIPWHILRVFLTLYGKMAQEWNNYII